MNHDFPDIPSDIQPRNIPAFRESPNIIIFPRIFNETKVIHKCSVPSSLELY